MCFKAEVFVFLQGGTLGRSFHKEENFVSRLERRSAETPLSREQKSGTRIRI